MTKMNRCHLLCIEKLSWRFYWNRMKTGRTVVLTSQFPKFTVCPPKNHQTMTKVNRVYLLGTEKLYWRFYQNRMKNGRAIVLTRKLHGQKDDGRQTLWLQYPSLLRGKKNYRQVPTTFFSPIWKLDFNLFLFQFILFILIHTGNILNLLVHLFL